MGAKNRPRHKLNENAVSNGTLNMTLSKTENFVDFFFSPVFKASWICFPISFNDFRNMNIFFPKVISILIYMYFLLMFF